MRRVGTSLAGVFVIEPERLGDERGFFARTFCRSTFAEWNLVSEYVQASVSYSTRRGTLRGMHYQRAPHGETKLVRCTRGAIRDVVVDLRLGSPTRLQSFSIELSAENRSTLYVPPGVAHGFLTLCDDAEVHYQMSTVHVLESAAGVRFDDPRLAIEWPFAPLVVSARDRAWPDVEA